MKTLLIFNDIESPLQYLIIDGDYSKFHGVVVNATNGTGYENEFCEFMWTEDGDRKHEFSNDKALLEEKNWDKIAICTWLP